MTFFSVISVFTRPCHVIYTDSDWSRRDRWPVRYETYWSICVGLHSENVVHWGGGWGSDVGGEGGSKRAGNVCPE